MTEAARERKNKDPEFLLYVFLKHGIRLPDDLKALSGSDDPFYAFQEVGMSKGKLCEILAREIVKEIQSGSIPGFSVRATGDPDNPVKTTKEDPA